MDEIITKVQGVFDSYRDVMPSESSRTYFEMAENDVIGILEDTKFTAS